MSKFEQKEKSVKIRIFLNPKLSFLRLCQQRDLLMGIRKHHQQDNQNKIGNEHKAQ